jgi:hypothetical protein
VRDRDDELQEQLPARTVTRITELFDPSVRLLPRSEHRRSGRLASISAPWNGATSAKMARGPNAIPAASGTRRRISCPMLGDTSVTDIAGADSAPVCTAVLVTLA